MENIELSSPDAIKQLNHLLDQDDEHWYNAWLVWCCSQLVGVKAALLVTDELCDGQFHAQAVWPIENQYDSLLQDIAESTLKQQQPLITPMDDGDHHAGSFPVFVDGHLRAVISLLFTVESESVMKKTLAMVEYSAGWIELHLSRTVITQQQTQQQRQASVVEGIAYILHEHDFDHAALRFVNILGRKLQADRVVLGFTHNNELKIHSQSDSSSQSNKHVLVKLTQKAMQEVVDQQESVLWPLPEGQHQVAVAHKDLADSEGQRVLLSVPLVDKELCYGAVFFERSGEQPFDQQDKLTAEAMANLIGVVLEEKRQSSLPLHHYIGRSFKNQLGHLIGPGHLTRKVLLMCLCALTLFFSFAKGHYNLSAEAVLEGAELRAIVVPFDSYLQNASVRAGDFVEQGALLAKLDTRELRLQRMTWLSQQATARRQYEDALANQQRAQVQVNNAQMQRASAELALLDYQLEQANLLAPFDALVVSGDLNQRIGSVMKQGEVLFELSPSSKFRLAMYVDEFRINDIHHGQEGGVVLAALSDMEFPLKITRINPVAEVRDGATVYRVEATLTQQNENLRVGLEGVAKVTVDERLLIKIWTRSLVDWLRLQIWTFWG